MDKINIIVFSKDRACQLELFLRSMKFYFKEFDQHIINVLYTYSNDKFKSGYDKLFTIHNDSNINYIKETQNFKNHILFLLDQDKAYTIFFVDDIVFKNDGSVERIGGIPSLDIHFPTKLSVLHIMSRGRTPKGYLELTRKQAIISKRDFIQ